MQKRPVGVGIGDPKNPDGGRDNHEGEQGADADQFGQETERCQRGRHGDDDAHQDGRFPGRLEPRVDRREDPMRQQSIAGHRQQNAWLAQVTNQ